MKITDLELNIPSILDVRKGRIPPSSTARTNRPSDCFVYVLTGAAEYTFDGRRYTVEAGDIFYLAAGSDYRIYVTDENYTYYYVDFLFENNTGVVFKNEVYRSKGISLLKSSVEKLYSLWKIGDFSGKIYCKALLYNIYSEIVKSSFSRYVSQDRRQQMEQIVNYITENLADTGLNVPALSKMCGISEVHFRRIFSYIYHISPVRFITAARISKAKELLAADKCSIADISERCGFQNHYYFSKVFKAETNMTPTQFRSFYESSL